MTTLAVVIIVLAVILILATIVSLSFWASSQAADFLKESHTKKTGHTKFKEEFQLYHYPPLYGPSDLGQADFAVVIWRCEECGEVVAPPKYPKPYVI